MAPVLDIYNDAVVNTTAVYDYQPRTAEAQAEWFAARKAQGWPVLVADEAGRVAGFASFGPFRPWPAYLYAVENAIYVAPDRRGEGIGSLLLPALIHEAKARHLHTMIAGIDAGNRASLRLHEKCGFGEIGRFREVGWKFDRWLDLVMMQRML